MPDKPATPPPAYFLSLSLENVRSFGKKQTISFATAEGRPAQWTIILGDNGVGKTTVLKSLAILRPMKYMERDSQLFHADNKHNSIKFEDFFYTAFSHFNQNREVLIRTGGEERSTVRCQISTGLSLKEFIVKNKSASAVEAKISIKGEYESEATILRFKQSGLICYGYGAGRTTGNSTLSETPNTADTCISLFNDRADLLNPEEWFLQADYRMKSDQDPLTTQNFHLLNAALLEVMAEGEVTELRVSPTQPGSGNPNQGMRFKTPYGWVRLKDMSLGYQTLVVWLTDFASKLFIRYPQSENPLREPAIVLIDEIDLHLHPSWQRKLLKSLSEIFVNTQFIATAHSPLVVQAATDAEANVVLLKREGDETIVSQNPVDVRGWRVDQILTSTFFNLETARSVETEKKLARQAILLNKEKLTPKQRRELDELTQELEGQPMGSSNPDAEEEEEAMLRELTRRAGKRPKA